MGTVSEPRGELSVAFEYGLLGSSGGEGPERALDSLLAVLRTDDPSTVYDEIKRGDGWTSVRIRFPAIDGRAVEQNIQISVGGVIVQAYLGMARTVVGDDVLSGRDLMITVSSIGDVNDAFDDQIIAFAQERWNGIPWDNVSGFLTSFDRS
jgi:hypothetical protein